MEDSGSGYRDGCKKEDREEDEKKERRRYDSSSNRIRGRFGSRFSNSLRRLLPLDLSDSVNWYPGW